MERIRPWYYDTFSCSADKCTMTCCQEWKIAVDEETEKEWEQLSCPEGMGFADDDRLSNHIGEKEGTRVVALCDHVCPFLNSDRLCSIVLSYGEEKISKTCRIFPRESKDIEDNLMPSCPDVIDRMMEKGFSLNREVGDIRDLFMEIAGDENISPLVALSMIFYISLEEKNVTARRDFHKVYSNETLKELQNAIEDLEGPLYDTLIERNELFLDMIENYRLQNMYENVLGPLARQLDAFESEFDCDESKMYAQYESFRKEICAYGGLIRALLQEEIYTSLRQNDKRSFMIRLQWLVMVFVMIHHGLFLQYRDKGMPSYEEIRSLMVVLFRMTGYDEEDITEYMEECFEDSVWEWGYFFLLCGIR